MYIAKVYLVCMAITEMHRIEHVDDQRMDERNPQRLPGGGVEVTKRVQPAKEKYWGKALGKSQKDDGK